MTEARLLRRKDRLTRRLMRRDQRSLERGEHRPQRERKWLRARIWKVDLELEQLGYFDVAVLGDAVPVEIPDAAVGTPEPPAVSWHA